jgi:hypothetical protein
MKNTTQSKKRKKISTLPKQPKKKGSKNKCEQQTK